MLRQHERLRSLLESARRSPAEREPSRASTRIEARERSSWLELFEDQVLSREVDFAARALRARNLGFYTIQSAGHELNALLGALLEVTDPCLLHYRSGALMLARARKGGVADPIRDVLLSLCASREDPIAQGRHKVWGSEPLWVPPQTSTIASHLPRAMGLAFALGRLRAHADAQRPRPRRPLPRDAIVCCSFGDASTHHASALSAIHAARYAHRRGTPMPILFVCEDNGLGISVPTPLGWIAQTFGDLPHLHYVDASGSPERVQAAVTRAIDHARQRAEPVFLRLETVRLFGHAGSDVETGYRAAAEIEADLARDPLLVQASWLLEHSIATPSELLQLVERAHARVAERVEEVAARPRLRDRREVMEPLAPYDEDRCRSVAAAGREVSTERRRQVFAQGLPELATAPARRTLAAHLGAALRDAMLADPHIWVFGEDVGRKGGVYHVTAGLQEQLGRERVFDTLLDETSILGVALGASLTGILPIPEIQYLAYLHNALDQLRGEACSLAYFSAGQFLNPLVVRVASFAYQKGFGGHFHNDDSIGALRDIPGLMLVSPARGDDGVRLLRAAIAIARACGRVVCFLEPIALYHEKDLFEVGDGAWLFDYPHGAEPLWPGELGLYGPEDADLTIVTYANGVRMSLRAARRLEREHGVRARVADLRWLAPLPWSALEHVASQSRALLVADECRASGGGIADAVVARFAERGYDAPIASVRSADCYVPLGPAADHVLLGEAEIVERALELASRARRA